MGYLPLRKWDAPPSSDSPSWLGDVHSTVLGDSQEGLDDNNPMFSEQWIETKFPCLVTRFLPRFFAANFQQPFPQQTFAPSPALWPKHCQNVAVGGALRKGATIGRGCTLKAARVGTFRIVLWNCRGKLVTLGSPQCFSRNPKISSYCPLASTGDRSCKFEAQRKHS